MKNSELKASVDLRVRIHSRNVKMNQAKIWSWWVVSLVMISIQSF